MIIFLLSVLGYAAVGIVCAKLLRNWVLDKEFKKQLEQFTKQHGDPSTIKWNRISSWDLIGKGDHTDAYSYILDKAKDQAEVDMATAASVGGSLWPLALPGWLIHHLYTKLPTSKAEKFVAIKLHEKDLDKQWQKMISEAESLGLDTKGLKAIGESRGVK